MLTLATGLRRGELLGLRWKEVDLENALINVTQQLVRVSEGNEFTDLKTRLSKRRVVIDNAVIRELAAHRER